MVDISSNNKSSFFTISLLAIVFGFWFAKMQLLAVSPAALASYPSIFLALTIVKCYLTIVAFFATSQLVLSYILPGKCNSTAVAMTFLPLLLVYVHCPLYWVASLILLMQISLFVLYATPQNNELLRTKYGVDVLALFAFFLCHFFLTTAYSPLHWNMALLTAHGFNSEEVPVVASIFREFVLAKQFAFTNFDHGQWAGIMNPPGTLNSPLLQLVTLGLDLPSVSYEKFHMLMMSIYFMLLVMGSFGFYLFLRYALKLHGLFAFFGGYLFYFSGSPLLLGSFTSDAGIFTTAQSCFPYALLMISLAFEKNDWRLSAGAGLALAAQFFLLSPHPEGTIYLLLSFSLFTLGLFLFSSQLTWYRKFWLATISYLIFVGLSAFYILPIMIDRLSGNMYVFSHIQDVSFTYMIYFTPYIHLIVLFGSIAFVLLAIRRKISAVFLSSLLMAVALAMFVSMTTHEDFNAKVVHFLHLGIHIWCPTRPGVYFYTSSFIIAMIGLNALTQSIFDLVNKRFFLQERR
jgi:hypothetical protein